MKRRGRYIGLLRPITYLLDISIVSILALFWFDLSVNELLFFTAFNAIAWIILSLKSKFYEVYRFTKVTKILSQSFEHFALFTLIVFFYFSLYHGFEIDVRKVFYYLISVFGAILSLKLSITFLLKRYRKFYGGNFRTTIIIGDNLRTQQLKAFFEENPEFGYKFSKMFSTKKNKDFLEECFKYVIDENIDEIYCSMAALTQKQINKIVDFADNNLRVLKFLPDTKDIYAKQLKIDYYGYLPILSLRQIPIEEPFNQFLKRAFDVIFSSMVIVFILSWLTPILAILIKLESPGPVFFKQPRNGINFKEFNCFKYRSMTIEGTSHVVHTRKNDNRVTRLGKFLRQTSIDELPQFFNVLIGEMSVVGPRPHMTYQTEMFAEKIDKFMVRHFVKPGITGLAQVSGYRGEIETDKDIINRVKYDIFYLENWSIFLDIRIIFITIVSAFKGDKKAY
jgi:putative colanic acid biosynthesis UDP-glucose lipid carrier transferase